LLSDCSAMLRSQNDVGSLMMKTAQAFSPGLRRVSALSSPFYLEVSLLGGLCLFMCLNQHEPRAPRSNTRAGKLARRLLWIVVHLIALLRNGTLKSRGFGRSRAGSSPAPGTSRYSRFQLKDRGEADPTGTCYLFRRAGVTTRSGSARLDAAPRYGALLAVLNRRTRDERRYRTRTDARRR
jgi:hypothetical protein